MLRPKDLEAMRRAGFEYAELVVVVKDEDKAAALEKAGAVRITVTAHEEG